MKYVFLILFAAVTVVHLIDSWKDDAKKRRRTKPFLLILILLYYVFSADGISWLLIGALLTSWLGDILLIPSGNKWFVSGGISFMISHFLFIAVYASNVIGCSFSGVIWWAVIPVAVIYIAISLFIIRAIKDTAPKMMIVPLYIYLLCNSAMNIFSLMQLMCLRSPASVIAYIGAVMFFISDCSLYLVRYHGNRNIIFKRHFTVMLTYVLGEFLITQGVLMIG